MCWFLRRGENRSTRRKTSRSKDENQQQTQPIYDTGTGSRTRWEASALTTAPSLLPKRFQTFQATTYVLSTLYCQNRSLPSNGVSCIHNIFVRNRSELAFINTTEIVSQLYLFRVSVKPGTHPEHPGTPPEHHRNSPEQPGTARNTPGTSHNTPEHPIMLRNTLNTARNTLEHQKFWSAVRPFTHRLSRGPLKINEDFRIFPKTFADHPKTK